MALTAEENVMTETRNKNLVSHLRSQFAGHADTRNFTFLHESRRQLVEEVTTFGDLDRSAREVAAWLSTRPEAQRPVLLLFEPGIDFWRAFLGCLYAGVIAIPAPLPHDERSMKRVGGILRDADSNLALTTAKLRDLLAAGIEGSGLNSPILCVAIDDSRLADADSWTIPHTTSDSVAFLQYTSGSTGDPKGVVVTHGNVLSNEVTISEALGVSDDSVIVTWIPHFHDMGLVGQLLAFFNGANLVTMSPLAYLKQPVRLLKAISDYRGTVSAAPNFAYDLIFRRVTSEQLAGLDLSGW
jgi:acyl-CoA synthetase (AMP-forming)/AMP-acid ligase II